MDFFRFLFLLIIKCTYYRVSIYNELLGYYSNLYKKDIYNRKKASLKSSCIIIVFLFFDLLLITPKLFLYVTFFRLKKLKLRQTELQDKIEKNLKLNKFQQIVDFEIGKYILILKNFVKAILYIILGAIVGIALVFMTWRVPTLIILMTRREFRIWLAN